MNDFRDIAGVVLAGGRSSRMGQDKAHLEFHGRKLTDHMLELLLQTGLENVFVSGRIGQTCTSFECPCLPDSAPYGGPASAIRNVLSKLQEFKGVLIVPVDMPLLTPSLLQELLQQEVCAHYESGPLPLFLLTDEKPGEGSSVRDIISSLDVKILSTPEDSKECFRNFNTPEEWRRLSEL